MTELSAKSRRGVVVAPHFLAAEAGRDVLKEGGNAIEAAVAAAAAIVPAYPHMNHIGGDGFWIIREPSGKHPLHRGLRICRRQGDASTSIRSQGSRRSRSAAPNAALTVPGAIGGWQLALDAVEGARRQDAALASLGSRDRDRQEGQPGHPFDGVAARIRARREYRGAGLRRKPS